MKDIFKNRPQRKGLIVKVYTMTPKKPNSALRKVAKVKIMLSKTLSTTIIAYIPGERHTLTIHNQVLVIPSKTQDLPGVKYKILRGSLDCKK